MGLNSLSGITTKIDSTLACFQNRANSRFATFDELKSLQREYQQFQRTFSRCVAIVQRDGQQPNYAKLDAQLNAAHALAVNIARKILAKEGEIALANSDLVFFP